MSKILLDMETLETIPERQHRMNLEDAQKVVKYFAEEQEEDITTPEGLTCEEAAKFIGPEGFEEETLQHIIYALFPDKYDPIY